MPSNVILLFNQSSRSRHPTIGSIGMTESEAREKYGDDKIKIYNTSVGRVRLNLVPTETPSAVQSVVIRHARRGAQATDFVQVDMRRAGGEGCWSACHRRG